MFIIFSIFLSVSFLIFVLQKMSRVPHREVGPLVAKIREFFLGRKHKNNLRFQDVLSPRPGPEAALPDGPSHKLAFNYYYTRDARREVAPPNLLMDSTKKVEAIEAGAGGEKPVAPVKKSKTPGRVYDLTTPFY